MQRQLFSKTAARLPEQLTQCIGHRSEMPVTVPALDGTLDSHVVGRKAGSILVILQLQVRQLTMQHAADDEVQHHLCTLKSVARRGSRIEWNKLLRLPEPSALTRPCAARSAIPPSCHRRRP